MMRVCCATVYVCEVIRSFNCVHNIEALSLALES